MSRINKGLVFKFLINESYYYGQVIYVNGKSITVVVFKDELATDDQFSILNVKPLLLVNTFSARFKSGNWIPCFETEIFRNGNVFPNYKLEQSDGTYLIDFKGNKIRILKGKETKNYLYETHVAPIRIEKAIEAFITKDGWKEEYDKMRFDKYFK